MSRYIDAELIEKHIKREDHYTPDERWRPESEFAALVDNIPTADVVEVVHGEWSHLGGDEWCCTNCGEVIHTEGSWEKPEKKFCHECGAKMDGKKVE